MDGLKRSRAASKGWLTKAKDTTSELLDLPDTDELKATMIEDAIKSYKARMAAFDNKQAAVENEYADEKLLLADIDESSKFRDGMQKTFLTATKWLKDHVQKVKDAVPGTSHTATAVSNSRLPTLQLPKFDGNILQWQNFWDQFIAMVDKTTLPNVSKFAYLQALLEGEAKNVIAGLPTTDANYGEACKLLQDRYNRKDRIIFAHIQALLNIQMSATKSPSKVASLWKLQDNLQSHVGGLQVLGISGRQYGVLLTPIVL